MRSTYLSDWSPRPSFPLARSTTPSWTASSAAESHDSHRRRDDPRVASGARPKRVDGCHPQYLHGPPRGSIRPLGLRNPNRQHGAALRAQVLPKCSAQPRRFFVTYLATDRALAQPAMTPPALNSRRHNGGSMPGTRGRPSLFASPGRTGRSLR